MRRPCDAVPMDSEKSAARYQACLRKKSATALTTTVTKQWMMFRWPVPQTLITVVAVTFNVYLKPIKYQPAR